ncbi:MAG: ATP-binding protein [Intrasporangium sp.]|uniref:ATP-binding protein n=1 Tax=Intrasporangium sp. TaxID=1925024 RepID=UPI003F81274D
MLTGRDRERAAIARLLEAARAGNGGAVVVRGVAGSGKSTLLAETVADLAGVTVLRTSGVESESPLAFAALQRLLWPLRVGLDALPAPQQAALRAALGEVSGDGDRFLTFLGTLSLLADAAEGAPVLVVVDDAQWLDDASAAALLFVARRLQTERVAMLLAAREGDVRRFEAPDLHSVTLGAVSGRDAELLLAAGGTREVDPGVRDQLVAATGGNPLALVELSQSLTGEQLTGLAPLPTPLPLTDGVERAFLDRYRRLPQPAQRLLLVAVADDTGRVTVVRDAAERLVAGEDALDVVERSGLLSLAGEEIHLYHPLVRSSVYGAATSAERRAAHRSLADALHDDPDRRAWHLAAAVDRPDEQVCLELDGVAERAASRGGHEAAAAAWARAAELTAGGDARARRLYLAASSAWLGAHPSRATALATAAAAHAADPQLRTRLLTLQGQIAWNTRSLNDGYDLILQAAEVARGVDPAMATQLAMLASSLAAFGARSARQVEPVDLVAPPDAAAPLEAHAAHELLQGFVAVARAEWAAASASFRRAFELTDAAPVDDHVLQPNLAVAALLIDDDDHALRLHEEQLTAAQRAGALTMIEHALTRGFHTQVATGSWSRAASAAAEALPLAASTGHLGMTALPTAELALVAALRGDDTAEQHLTEVAEIRAQHRIGITDGLVVDLTHWTAGLRAAAQPATALLSLEQLREPSVRRMAALDLFDTAVRAGRLDMVRTWLDELVPFAEGVRTPASIAVVEHGNALLAEGAEAEPHFALALAAHADSPRLPDRARTELAFGEWLRRARRRVDAREHLRTALALFEELGARPWAERAAQELRASGETARRRDVSTATDLTAQERQVAGLVRQGLSNRDAAARLFVSPRTIDFHLRNVFSKLGVSSRAELTALALDV